MATARDSAPALSPPIDQPNTLEPGVDAAAAVAPASNNDKRAAELTGDDLTERPLGWCFRTRSGREAWLAVSPPGEPPHELRSDSRVVWNGSRSAWLGTEAPADSGPYTDIMWQTIDAAPYRGARIELSAQFRDRRSRHGGVHFFLRTQRATEKEVVLHGAGAAPQNVLFSGFTDWVRASVVGDVPRDADVIILGVAVYNRGYVWIDDARLTKVAKSTPLTNNPSVGGEAFTLPLGPVQPFDMPTNLDFEATNLDPTGQPLKPAGC